MRREAFTNRGMNSGTRTMRPLRIALLTHSVRPRGGVIHTLELAQALCALGHVVVVIASAEQGESLFRQVDHPFELIRLPQLSGDLVEQVRQRISCLCEGLPAILERGSFDIVHAQDSLSGNALATLRERGQLSAPWLRTVHHLDVFSQPVLNTWQERAWRSADSVACVSDMWRSHIQDAYGTNAMRMFNGVNLNRFSPQRATFDDEGWAALGLGSPVGPICLTVGGVEGRKNTVRLLKAFALLRLTDPAWADATLVVAGGASMLDHAAARSEWHQVLAGIGLVEGAGQPVVRTGPLPDEMLPALMRRADVLAMPSLVEGFGLAALEALACGTPALVSNRAPFTEHFAGSPGVAWCDPEDVGSIALGLKEGAAMGRLPSPPPICKEYSWSRSALLHHAWYSDAIRAAQSLSVQSVSI